MTKVIPNEESWIGFTTVQPVDTNAPTLAELTAATNLTPFIVGLNPTSQGNAIPTPALDSLFDRSVIGTSQGAFSGDLYRDKPSDLAWLTLPRGTRGWFFVSRFGGSTAVTHMPTTGESLEVWDITITQRAASAMTSNTVQTFSVTGAVNEPPKEAAIVAATSGVPSVPRNVIATAGATGIAVIDWDAPLAGAPILSYKIYKSTVAGGAGAYTEVTTNITKVGTTATLTAVTAGLTYFKVLATNAAGDGPQSSFGSCTVT